LASADRGSGIGASVSDFTGRGAALALGLGRSFEN
jgi:hypothetical protein